MILTSSSRITFCSVSLSFNKALHSRGSLCSWQMISQFAFFNFSPLTTAWPLISTNKEEDSGAIIPSQKSLHFHFCSSLGETLAVTSAIILWWAFFVFLTRTDPFADQQGFCAFYLRLLPIHPFEFSKFLLNFTLKPKTHQNIPHIHRY